MPLPVRVARWALLLPLFVLGAAGCGEENAGPGEVRPSAPTPAPSSASTVSPSPTRIPATEPEVTADPDWSRTVEESGYPVMPTR